MWILIGVVILIIVVVLYAYLYEPFQLVVKEEYISDKCDVKIIQITDIHYGKSFNTKMLKRVVDKINALDKDIVVFSGDLFVDSYTGEVTELTEVLKSIDCPYKYAVWGNHDYKEYAIQHFENVLTNADFKILKDQQELIEINNKKINVVGTDDFRSGTPDEELIHSMVSPEADFNLLIIHVPDVAPLFVDDGYNLILSGHTHGGQVRPFFNVGWRTSYGRVYINDLFELENNTKLYVSTGLGTTSFRLRFRTKPSLTILHI